MRNPTFLLATLAALAVAQSDYSAPGRFAAAFRTEDIPGSTELMQGSRIYYPESAGVIPRRAAPAPVVVFGHGWQMGIDRYYSYAEHLATWGYIAVLPTISNPIIRPEHDRRARLMADAARFAAALDTVTGDPFAGRVARANWGFCGHSMGGGLAMLAADTLRLGDSLRAVAALASPQTDPPTNAANVRVPKLVIGGGTDNTAPWPAVREAYWQGAPAPGTFGVVRGANHGYFMDYSYFWENGGTAGITREEQLRSARRWLTAIFERYLHGDEGNWNTAWLYGDSLRSSPAFESVEVRLTVAVRDRAARLQPRLSVRPNPFSNWALLSGYESSDVLVYDAGGSLVGVLSGPAVGGDLGPGVYFLRSADGDGRPVRVVKAR
ncbi:MAG: dienelactone hydrolase family protein [bacterium]